MDLVQNEIFSKTTAGGRVLKMYWNGARLRATVDGAEVDPTVRGCAPRAVGAKIIVAQVDVIGLTQAEHTALLAALRPAPVDASVDARYEHAIPMTLELARELRALDRDEEDLGEAAVAGPSRRDVDRKDMTTMTSILAQYTATLAARAAARAAVHDDDHSSALASADASKSLAAALSSLPRGEQPDGSYVTRASRHPLRGDHTTLHAPHRRGPLAVSEDAPDERRAPRLTEIRSAADAWIIRQTQRASMREAAAAQTAARVAVDAALRGGERVPFVNGTRGGALAMGGKHVAANGVFSRLGVTREAMLGAPPDLEPADGTVCLTWAALYRADDAQQTSWRQQARELAREARLARW